MQQLMAADGSGIGHSEMTAITAAIESSKIFGEFRIQICRTNCWASIYASNGLAGSRSGGLIAATWAAMVRYGREGYLRYAKQIFEASFEMQGAVKTHTELTLMGKPTFCFRRVVVTR